ncbi:MAG: nucleoside transporter C-terminal domain-containing protein, partial [Gammaproteobacteria bacterium]
GDLGDASFSPRTVLILSYALSGFANIGSLGILIGGLTAMAPTRRDEIIQLAPKALIAGTFATLLTGSMIGLIH